MKKIFGFWWKAIPILYRYFAINFLKDLLIIFIAFFLIVFLISSLDFLNFVKQFSLVLLLKYALTSTIVYTPLFIPVLEFVAIARTFYPVVEKKLNWGIFASGISPWNISKPFLGASALVAFLLVLNFQFLYPKAAYDRHIDYLQAKNNLVKQGIAQNFWYRFKDGRFLYFRLIHLDSKRAFRGFYFAVNKDFGLKWVSYIPIADFKLKKNVITITAKNVKRYTPKGVKKEILSLTIPYKPKLLHIKKPSYFSISELYNLIIFVKNIGTNYYPYLWEFIKRIVIVILAIFIPPIAAVYLFASTNIETFFIRSSILLISLIISYVVLLLFQTLVVKNFLNPIYGLASMLPIALVLIVIGIKEKD